MNPQWISLGVTIVVVLVGTAVNLFLIGRFVGSFTEAMRNLTQLFGKIEERVEAVEDRSEDSRTWQADVAARLEQAERGTAVVAEFRDEFIAMRATVQSETRHSNEKLDSVVRSIGVIERQLANISSRGLEFGRGEKG